MSEDLKKQTETTLKKIKDSKTEPKTDDRKLSPQAAFLIGARLRPKNDEYDCDQSKGGH